MDLFRLTECVRSVAKPYRNVVLVLFSPKLRYGIKVKASDGKPTIYNFTAFKTLFLLSLPGNTICS